MTATDGARRGRAGVVIFYIVFVAMFVAEGILVHGIRRAAAAADIGPLGTWIAWVVFVVGGAFLGLYELRAIAPERKMRDPILRLCCYLYNRLGVAGYLVGAVFIGGAGGIAIAARSAGSRHAVPLTLLAAGLFATVWVPAYSVVWR